MPTPVFQYTDPGTKLPWGAVFSVTATGTNPNVLLLIEARPDEQGNLRWHYGFARLNGTSGEIRLDEQPVWKIHEPPHMMRSLPTRTISSIAICVIPSPDAI
jgi:hypothetical protein